MGQVTFKIDAGAAGTTEKAFTVTNANIQRMIDWIKARTPDGAAMTNAQAVEAWAQLLMGFSRQQVLEHERRALAPPAFDVS